MSELQELFSEVEEEFDEEADDWDIPTDDDDDDWAETWLDGIDGDDVDGYSNDDSWWNQDYT